MRIKAQFLSVFLATMVVSAAAAAIVPERTGNLTLEIRNAGGRAIAGTTVTLQADWLDQKSGISAHRDGQLQTSMRPGAPRPGRSDEHGELAIPAASVFGARQADTTRTTIFLINEVQKLGAMIDVSPADMSQTVSVTLQPLCFVHGKLDSPDMEAEGHVMKHSSATVATAHGKQPIAKCGSENARFGMLLPAGTYELALGGVATDGATYGHFTQSLEVEKGKTELDLEALHFASSKLSELLGKPAPEFQGIIEWRNGEPVTLEKLRGKVVVLDFWSYACSICIAEMPSLFQMQKQYANNPDLVIIAVHSPLAQTLDEAYEKSAHARQLLWHGADFPFRVALDSAGADHRGGTMAAYGVVGVPNTLLIDRDGILDQRFYHAGVPGFKEEVARLLNAKPKLQPTTAMATATPMATTKNVPANPALATPETALRAFLNAKKKGDSAAYRRVASRPLLEGMEAIAMEDGDVLKIDAEEYFSKLTVVDVKTEQNLAIITAKVVYNRKWLDAHNKDLSAMETSAGAPAGVVEFELLPEQGEMQWEDPIATKGEGFAAFAMKKEDEGWKFHLGYMTDKQANLKKVGDAFQKKSSPASRPALVPQVATVSLTGKPAPEFSLNTVDGKTVTLAEMKGNVVVLDHWATWCGPCRQSLPHLQKMSDDESLTAKGLRVFAVNDREPIEKVKPFLEKNNFTFTVPMDTDGKFKNDYSLHGLPITIIIGRDGKVKKVFIGYGKTSDDRIDAAVNDALAEQEPA